MSTDKPADALRRLRRAHEDAVLATLRSAGALSRAQLVQQTGLSRTTLFAIISDLMERGAVVEIDAPATEPRGRGRPAALVALNPDAGLFIGVDLGRRRVRLAVANVAHEVIVTGMDDIPAGAGAERQAEAAVRLIRRVGEEHGVRLSALEAVGLGLFGIVDDPSLPASTVPARYAPITRLISEEFGVRVAVDNNARLAALAENTWGAARSVGDMVYARWSVGVGGGFIVGGRLLRGAHGAAGEIGHVSLDPEGPECHCGGRGCLERRIGSPALLEACAARGVAVSSLDELIAAAQDRVPTVCSVISDAAADLGRILADTVIQLDPERIVVGGEFAALGSLVLDPIRAAIDRLALPNARRRIEVSPADLGVNASAMGAIAFLLNEEPARPRL